MGVLARGLGDKAIGAVPPRTIPAGAHPASAQRFKARAARCIPSMQVYVQVRRYLYKVPVRRYYRYDRGAPRDADGVEAMQDLRVSECRINRIFR